MMVFKHEAWSHKEDAEGNSEEGARVKYLVIGLMIAIFSFVAAYNAWRR